MLVTVDLNDSWVSCTLIISIIPLTQISVIKDQIPVKSYLVPFQDGSTIRGRHVACGAESNDFRLHSNIEMVEDEMAVIAILRMRSWKVPFSKQTRDLLNLD
jgi:hypothetical protein